MWHRHRLCACVCGYLWWCACLPFQALPLRLKNVKKLLLNAAKYNLLFNRGKRQTLSTMCAQGVGVHSRPISGIVVCGGEVDEWAGGSGAGGSVGGAWPVCVGKLNSVDCLVVNLNKAHLHTHTHARTRTIVTAVVLFITHTHCAPSIEVGHEAQRALRTFWTPRLPRFWGQL